MKKESVEKALRSIRAALRAKYGVETQARVTITEDSVSLDDEEGAVICDQVRDDVVADELGV